MNSLVFEKFAEIIAEKDLVKTAADKDKPLYDVVPEAAGPDMKVETTGYELVEMAHPDQCEVYESRLQDGIIENGVEAQKLMIEVALRNPRAVLAEVAKVLVKIASEIEDDMSIESLKIANEIDSFLMKIADEQPAPAINLPKVTKMKGDPTDWGGTIGGASAVGLATMFTPLSMFSLPAATLYGVLDRIDKGVGDIYEQFEKTGDTIEKMDFGYFFGLKRTKEQTDLSNKMKAFGEKLKGYGELRANLSEPEQKQQLLKETYDAIVDIQKNQPTVQLAIQKATDWGYDANNASLAWNKLSGMCTKWLQLSSTEIAKLQTAAPQSAVPGAAAGQAAGGKLCECPEGGSKPHAPHAPGQKPPISRRTKHSYRFYDERIKTIQEKLGFTGGAIDGKMGHDTYTALSKRIKDIKSYEQISKEDLDGFIKQLGEQPAKPNPVEKQKSTATAPEQPAISSETRVAYMIKTIDATGRNGQDFFNFADRLVRKEYPQVKEDSEEYWQLISQVLQQYISAGSPQQPQVPQVPQVPVQTQRPQQKAEEGGETAEYGMMGNNNYFSNNYYGGPAGRNRRFPLSSRGPSRVAPRGTGGRPGGGHRGR